MQTANILLTYSLSITDQQGSDFVNVGLSGNVAGTKDRAVTWDQIKTIAEDKMPDLNCFTVESAMKMVAGTARSMGLNVKGKAPWSN